MHQVGIIRNGGLFQAGENSCGSAVLHGGVVHDPYGLLATPPSLRMGTENHRVSRLDGHDALEQHRRGGVGNGCDREAQYLGRLARLATFSAMRRSSRRSEEHTSELQ